MAGKRNQEIRDRVQELLSQGLSDEAIAAELGKSVGRITQLRQESNKFASTRRSAPPDNLIHRLYVLKRLDVEAIADQTGYSINSIKKVIKLRGWKKPKPFPKKIDFYLKPGFKVGFKDEDGFQIATVDRLYGAMVLVVLDSGAIWPLRMDELLPPF